MQVTSNPQPSLIVVTGRPGSGKTTLAHALAPAIRCPLISRDEIKEGLVRTTGHAGNPGEDIARKAYDVFFDTLSLLLSRQVTVIAEAAFQHKLWAPKLEPLREIARIRIIVCSIAPDVARARRIKRHLEDPARARFHPDPAALAAPEASEPQSDEYDAPHLDVPTLAVDTSDEYQPAFEQIVLFACE